MVFLSALIAVFWCFPCYYSGFLMLCLLLSRVCNLAGPRYSMAHLVSSYRMKRSWFEHLARFPSANKERSTTIKFEPFWHGNVDEHLRVKNSGLAIFGLESTTRPTRYLQPLACYKKFCDYFGQKQFFFVSKFFMHCGKHRMSGH